MRICPDAEFAPRLALSHRFPSADANELVFRRRSELQESGTLARTFPGCPCEGDRFQAKLGKLRWLQTSWCSTGTRRPLLQWRVFQERAEKRGDWPHSRETRDQLDFSGSLLPAGERCSCLGFPFPSSSESMHPGTAHAMATTLQFGKQARTFENSSGQMNCTHVLSRPAPGCRARARAVVASRSSVRCDTKPSRRKSTRFRPDAHFRIHLPNK